MTRRRRILHVFDGTLRGGIETAMMQVFRRIDRTRYAFDFAVRSAAAGHYDDEIRALGGRILRCSGHRNPLAFARRLAGVLAAGEYDVVHSHVDLYTGVVLPVAAAAGVPVRIAHIHNDRRGQPVTAARRAYGRLMRASVGHFATHGFAPSAAAARFLFGDGFERDRRWQVQPYGVDFAPFEPRGDGARLRASLGIAKDAMVVGHVGRFDPQKNHDLIARVLAALSKIEPRVFGLLVGDGRLRADIVRTIADHGITDRVALVGVRTDVPALLCDATDVFFFPSKHEGLGLALVEAQAAGLPCVISDVVPPEAVVLPESVISVSLDASVDDWVGAIVAAANRGRTPGAASRLAASDFAIATAIRNYTAVYDRARPAEARSRQEAIASSIGSRMRFGSSDAR